MTQSLEPYGMALLIPRRVFIMRCLLPTLPHWILLEPLFCNNQSNSELLNWCLSHHLMIVSLPFWWVFSFWVEKQSNLLFLVESYSFHSLLRILKSCSANWRSLITSSRLSPLTLIFLIISSLFLLCPTSMTNLCSWFSTVNSALVFLLKMPMIWRRYSA